MPYCVTVIVGENVLQNLYVTDVNLILVSTIPFHYHMSLFILVIFL